MEDIGSAALFLGFCVSFALAITTLEDWLAFHGPSALATDDRLRSLPLAVQQELLDLSPRITNRDVRKALKRHARAPRHV